MIVLTKIRLLTDNITFHWLFYFDASMEEIFLRANRTITTYELRKMLRQKITVRTDIAL